MPISELERQRASRGWGRKAFEEENQTATLNLNQIKAAVDAFDSALDSQQNTLGFVNQATLLANLNNLLPEPFKSTATPMQKALLLARVLLARAGAAND